MGTIEYQGEVEESMAVLPSMSSPILYVNGKRRELPNGYAETTLLEYLREIGLPGTKLGCGEGGCGACTVMVSHYDHGKKKIVHRSVNACLAPLYSVEGMHVVTVEGIGNRKNGLHPVQTRLSQAHGSQCGFCTPGFVMSMYSLLRSSPLPPTEEEIEENLAGNLCRCTGYRPILDAFRVFAKNETSIYTRESLEAAGIARTEKDTNGFKNGEFICPSTGKPCDCGKETKPEKSTLESAPLWGSTTGNGLNDGHFHAEKTEKAEKTENKEQKTEQKTDKTEKTERKTGKTENIERKTENGECVHGSENGTVEKRGYPTTSPSEPIFPPELMNRKFEPLELNGSQGTVWYRPTSMESLLKIKKKYPTAKLVVGNSEVGIEMRFKQMGYRHLIGTTAVPELNMIREKEGEGIEIGAAVTLSSLMDFLRGVIKDKPTFMTVGCSAIVEQLRWFAGNQIRNVASVGGNICTASPISDLNPLWISTGSIFNLQSDGSKSRHVAAKDFFLGYRKVDLGQEEILGSVFLPWTQKFEYIKEFKQAHRRDDDIALVNAGFRVQMGLRNMKNDGKNDEKNSEDDKNIENDKKSIENGEKSDEKNGKYEWIVKSASLSYGGVAAMTISAKKTEKFLNGKAWNQSTLTEALAVLREEILIPDTAPGGMPEFRRSLVSSFFFKFFVHVSTQLEKEEDGNFVIDFPDSYRSAVFPYEKPPSRGIQYFEMDSEKTRAGVPMMHMSAELQVTGEAEYADDFPMPINGLHGALVMSSKPHAKILSIDCSQAETVPGFVSFFSAKDVPGKNDVGAVVHDEEVYASEKVTCVGQIIGVVVANSHLNAKIAAKKVKIEYEELPAIFTIEEAIEAKSFHEIPFSSTTERKMSKGDVESCFSSGECDHIVEGKVQMGGQEQFYLEPQISLVWTLDNGSEVHMISSTQAPTHHQKDVARCLGLPLHKVVCKTKRIGGGFGGKETRSAIVATAAAIPSFALNRPVKIVLDRDTDMAITGHRHPFLGKYKVGFTKEGKILALDLELYNNGGNSLDLSHAILERAMFHSDNVYDIPNVKIIGKICRTNIPSNTAFRGFGGPQGLLICENWIEHIARTVGKPVDVIQELNFHPERYEVHYGQIVEKVQTQRIWKELKSQGEWEKRRTEVTSFNSQNRWKKRGLAMVPTKFGISFTTKFLNQGGALVNIYSDGTVLVTHGGVEMGQGLHTKVAQIASEILQCPFSSVFISETSTDKVPNSSPTAASASSDIYGQATMNACLELFQRIKPVRESMPKATFAQVAEKCYFERINLSAQGFFSTPEIYFDWRDGKGHPFAYHTYGAAMAEVEIDTLTGAFSLPRVDIIMDVGKSINPAIDIGQVEGGFAQGLGWAVMEELKWGDKCHPWIRPGNLFTQGPGTYKIPSTNDIPVDFRVSLLREAPNPKAVLSSKAVGEPPFFLGASVVFAIKEAIISARKDSGIEGFFVLDTPSTPERVRMACTDEFTVPFASTDFRAKLSV